VIPPPGADRRRQLSHVVVDAWPVEWSRRYFSHGYLFHDPAIERVLSSTTPFLWSELGAASHASRTARRIMGEAAEFGLKEGFTVPLVTLEGEVAGFSLAGERVETSPRERGMLGLVATYALGRALALRQACPKPAARLSARERQALQWAAEGLSDSATGDRMGISEHGVDKHMRSVRFKLGAGNRTHAVAEALRQRLIV
jgi:LuxR family quorum sensing-dependent transcriptional regulator